MNILLGIILYAVGIGIFAALAYAAPDLPPEVGTALTWIVSKSRALEAFWPVAHTVKRLTEAAGIVLVMLLIQLVFRIVKRLRGGD